MYLFGHVGITLGAAALAAQAISKRHVVPPGKSSFFAPLARYLDIRLLVIGSMLPDIIDKPLGMMFFKDTFSNGRILSHTLLFLALLTGIGYYLYRRRKALWMLTLAAGIFTHLILDEMWRLPGTLFWPFLGLQFDKLDLEGIYTRLLDKLFSNPNIYVSEAIGLVIVIWFAVWVISRKKTGDFILKGRIY